MTLPDNDPTPLAAGPVAAADAADALDAGVEGAEPDDSRGTGDRSSTTRTIVEWAMVIVGALVVALVIKTFLLQAFYIPSRSMEPTLRIGDRVLVNKVSYDLHDVNRGDVVVFERPPTDSPDEIKDLIKRVIALPGETIGSVDGQVFIDGRALDEPYLAEGTRTDNLESQVVPDGYVFVLGDNRGDSRDSRYFGPIDTELIVGRAFVRVWPLTHLGFL